MTRNLCLVRVHAFVPREISLLSGQNLSLRFSTSSVQSVQENVENPQETARRQASTNASWSSESSIAGWPHAENSPAAINSSLKLDLTLRRGLRCWSAIWGFALPKRTLGFGLGRPLLSLSSKRLGLVCDGGQAVPSKSSRLPRSGAPAGPRTCRAGLRHSQRSLPPFTDASGPRSPTRFWELSGSVRAGLDRATLPFSSYQSIAELPRPTQSQIAGQTLARSALPTCPASSGVARWPQVANRAQKTEASCSASNRTARHAHDRWEFLRRIDHFRAYRKYQQLDLPTTTGSVEAMNRRVRDLMRQTRNIKSPQALHLWATALIRTRIVNFSARAATGRTSFTSRALPGRAGS